MRIRAEKPGDCTAIHALTATAFGRPVEARLVDALRADGDAVISLVAEADGLLEGHVLLSRLRMPANCLALGPVSVAPPRQRTGVGSALIRHALKRAADAGYAAIFVLGDPGYYTRFGFSTEAAAPFETDYPRQYFMALELASGALAGLSGPVIYPPPFDAA